MKTLAHQATFSKSSLKGWGAYHSALALSAVIIALASSNAHAQVSLADQPLLTIPQVPGNLALALSVEYPTAVSVAHLDGTYSSSATYLGLFDANKCYSYRSSSSDSTVTPNTAAPNSYFYPDGLAATNAAGVSLHTCSSKWSGNFLNWAAMQTIDSFRWALTGGYRVVDTSTLTVVEKAWASGQGGTGNFPDRSLSSGGTISAATPLGFNSLNLQVQGLGNKLRFFRNGATGVPVHYSGGAGVNATVYEVFVRAKVCDSSSGAGGLESNCKIYGTNYKPEGLIQKYANKIRYSAFGYLNDSNVLRDGGVLRARQKFVGPTEPVVGSSAINNTAKEWDATHGIFVTNPDTSDVASTTSAFGVTVANSGVINYLNKFGLTSRSYKTYDPVGELYYAALRYYRALGNVPEWTNSAAAVEIDGFPVITQWDDPIQYSCQKNFILGIGDVNTHADANVPGAGTPTGFEPTKPSSITSDASVNAVTATNKVGVLQGLGATLGTATNYGGCCSDNTALMAGLAYDAHTKDIRPDVTTQARTIGKQTVDTYWLDVQEYSAFKSNNQFLLAAKFGGFTVPAGYDTYANTTPLAQALWSTNGDTLSDGTPRPNNYFLAGAPDKMITGLNAAFASISSQIAAFSTSFALPSPFVVGTDNGSYSASYDPNNWTGEVFAKRLSFDSLGAPTYVDAWAFSQKLATQLAANGWDTGRRVATWNPAAASGSGAGVAFRRASLSATQRTALDTSYFSGDDSQNYLNYLRGDTTHEQGSTVSSSTRAYRTRTKLLGDIIDSKLVPVGPPSFPFSDSTNPGYSVFKGTWASRRTVVYAAANDGMLHAINGALVTSTSGTLEADVDAGKEMFAYVPSLLISGPNGTPNTDGLAALGDPGYVHKNFVNATPVVFDIDFGRTPNASGVAQTNAADWRTILVGGLGKGGKGYYALDVTNPAGIVSGGESTLAGKVLWEFTHADLGYTFDAPIVAKTRKYGWVLVFGSGYSNTDGVGYFFFVNPRTGALLEKISTGEGTDASPAGLAYVNGYALDGTDGTIDAVYAGDLLGNVWRVNVTATSGSYPAPTKIASLRDASNNAQPVTSRPIIEIQPRSNKRFVMLGTGRLLHSTDTIATRMQTFYSFLDGNNVAFSTQMPNGSAFPIRRANLAQMTNPVNGVTLNSSTQFGWYLDLGNDTATGVAWQDVSEATGFYGMVGFSSVLMLSEDACTQPTGRSRIYVLDYETGKSRQVDVNPNSSSYNASTANVIAYTAVGSIVTDLKFLSKSGSLVGMYGTNNGSTGNLNLQPLSTMGLRRLNWREIPVVD